MGFIKDIMRNLREGSLAEREEMRARTESIRSIWDKYQVPIIVAHAKEVFAPVEDWGSTNHISLRKPSIVHTLGVHYEELDIPRHEDRWRKVTKSRHVFSIGLSESGFYIARDYRGSVFLGTTQTIAGHSELFALADRYINKK